MLRRGYDGEAPGYRWGPRGTLHPYTPGDEGSRRRALRAAQREGRVVPSADASWRIAEPSGPSPRGLVQTLRRWVREEMAPVYRDVIAAGERWHREREARRASLVSDAEVPVGLTVAESAALTAVLLDAVAQASARTGERWPGAAVEREVERAARHAAGASRRRIVTLGADRDRLADVLGVPRSTALTLTGPLSPGEQEAWRRWVSGVAVPSPTGERYTGLALVRRIPQEAVQGMEAWIVPARLEGRRWDTIARELQSRLGIDDRHAELIARDQIGKLNGAITEATQVAAGIEEYTWRTSQDERVRELHVDLDGTRHRWDSPPESGTKSGETIERLPPGLPIQCRCWADPVIPDRLIA